jgi:alanine-glyoxylate transaminase/serine-glyoxylate transaminase/serine-pyruvate transaminase
VENAAQPNSTSYPALDTPERILLGPGPSMVHPRVLKAMARPLVGHLDPTFIQVMDRIQSL